MQCCRVSVFCEAYVYCRVITCNLVYALVSDINRLKENACFQIKTSGHKTFSVSLKERLSKQRIT